MLSFLINNYLDEANLSLSSGTVNAQFPLSNLKNSATVKKFRTTTNTCKVVIDLQQTRDIDAVAVHGDSTQSLGVTSVGVKFSLNTDFSGYTQFTIPLDADSGMGFVLLPSSQSYRYIELEMSGNGSFVELSNVYVGKRQTLEINSFDTNSFEFYFKDNSSVSQNDYGQKFINVRNKVKCLGGDINTCTKAEQNQIDKVFQYHRITKPLWVIVDDAENFMIDGKYKLSIYGYLTNLPKWQPVGGPHWNTSLEFEQVV